MRTTTMAAAVAVLATLAACKKTGEGTYEVQRPTVGVTTDTVHTPTVSVGSKSETVSVPKVEVKHETTTVKVPNVKVKP